MGQTAKRNTGCSPRRKRRKATSARRRRKLYQRACRAKTAEIHRVNDFSPVCFGAAISVITSFIDAICFTKCELFLCL